MPASTQPYGGDVLASFSLKLTTGYKDNTVKLYIPDLRKKRQRGAKCGSLITTSSSISFEASSTELARDFVRKANQIKNWQYLYVSTTNGVGIEFREFLIPSETLPSLKAENPERIHMVYQIGNGGPRVYCGGYMNFGLRSIPSLPRLVIDPISAAAQVKGQPISFPGPLEKRVSKKHRQMPGWNWNILRDNHQRWTIPRDLLELSSDSVLFGVFSEQSDWEQFLESLVGRVLNNYDCLNILTKVYRTSGNKSEHTADEPSGTLREKKCGFIYDGPSRGMTLVKLGNHFVYVFEVGFADIAQTAFVLDLNEYGRSMRIFRSFEDALSHAEGREISPVFRVEHDEHRQRRFQERFRQHLNLEFSWQ